MSCRGGHFRQWLADAGTFVACCGVVLVFFVGLPAAFLFACRFAWLLAERVLG